ncbi:MULTISPECIES: hypothetical protein [unclassified Streptomyces]|uniref:hypothetical protein n=1 Tax=unclassified Streptomyces TaxID=2593676 RepID=UPI00225832CB|nr:MULTISPECIES: hypothetical protein [unclassified Streptomyces]MCX4526919.1 hypothetical protein [Streptomyces sp. NBC_01551]MCX4542521.1 hypothetical protein [Streptomyces sp. NBC_01565]
MPIAELQVCSVEEADVTGGVCVVRVIGGIARAGQVYTAGGVRLGLTRIEAWGRTAEFVDPPHAARAHLTGPMVALLARGQVLTAVPPAGHTLEDLEAWLATGPPLLDEPHPDTLRSLAVGRMQDDGLPDGVRLRWGRVALAAARRAAEWRGADPLVRGAELAAVRGYLIERFGPGPAPDGGGDPAALCRDLLALIDLTPQEAAAAARTWRDLPRERILHLRRVKNLLPWMARVRPHLADTDPLARAVDAWTAIRPQLP